MTPPFTLLIPDNLTRRESGILRAALGEQHLTPSATIHDFTHVPHHHVLSVGKQALDTWHGYGLIRVGHNHGDTFLHDGHVLMVLEHPGALMQMSMLGHRAKDELRRDLLRWALLLDGQRDAADLRPSDCAGCMKGREPKFRAAYRWPTELDGVGLCDDHYRRRAKYTKRPKPRVKPGSREAQIDGQVEAFADGAHLMVSKG